MALTLSVWNYIFARLERETACSVDIHSASLQLHYKRHFSILLSFSSCSSTTSLQLKHTICEQYRLLSNQVSPNQLGTSLREKCPLSLGTVA